MAKFKGPNAHPKARVTCSIEYEEYVYVARRASLQFSALLSAAIRSLMRKDGIDPDADQETVLHGTPEEAPALIAHLEEAHPLPEGAPTRAELPAYQTWLVARSSDPAFMALPREEKFKLWRAADAPPVG